MFSLQTFKSVFIIPPRCLSKEWKEKFLEIVQKEKNRTVSQSNGAILEVKEVSAYELPKMQDGKIIAPIVYGAFAFNPAVGAVHTGDISLILPLGILVEAEGLVKIMIQPANLPAGYKYDGARKVFTNGVHSYTVGDSIRFRITNIKYKPGEINCIGSAKDLPATEPELDDLAVIEPPDEFID
jgi:DNA-directed RNA polymerase subunit E'/Rpb7